jgi:photosystem II stability/assembly factor-like uncharacterized protein
MRTAAASLALLLAFVAHGAPVLFHEHGHGLSFSADGRALLAPSERGLAVYENRSWRERGRSDGSFSAFSASERALYSSGHAQAGGRARGLLRSTDGGRSWQAIGAPGQADFPMIAAGYRSGVLYVLNATRTPVMPTPGIYLTHDDGNSWMRADARGLEGEIHGLAAHPHDARIVAVATGSGLYLSRDAGASFRRLGRGGAVTALAFDIEGKRLRYAFALSSELVESALDGRQRRTLRLPRLEGDYVTCLAQNPKEAQVLAFATRKREVYVTQDGASWRRIAAEQEESSERDR